MQARNLMKVASANGSTQRAALIGFVTCLLIVSLQPPGLISADTKMDLLINPGQFLSHAFNLYTDRFTFGQLQNQAYGYFFPHGAFFLLGSVLNIPLVIVERSWWLIVLFTGYLGSVLLLKKLDIGTFYIQIVASFTFVLAPRTLSNLTTISSEVWPIMLTPWILLPIMGTQRSIALSVIAAGFLGGINATASWAAVLPAALYFIYELSCCSYRSRTLKHFLWWGVGVLGINSWWIIPLGFFSRFSAPFVDFIENTAITTRWLNLAEILRGTTSWVPFVDSERSAGFLLVSSPTAVVLTLAVATMGLWGLASYSHRSFWLLVLGVGLIIFGGAGHIPTLLDSGPFVALRNISKFDALLRLPLMVGIAHLGTRFSSHPKEIPAQVLISTLAVASFLPALSGGLMPKGAFEKIPSYWYQAAEYLETHAAHTRTLVLPARAFARQEWGWTRDEPIQFLTDIPFAVRDAIPLINSEAIRGLDGMTVVPTLDNLRRHGIGAVLVRHDVNSSHGADSVLDFYGPTQRFGEVEIALIEPDLQLLTARLDQLPIVSAGGEGLALMGAGAYQLATESTFNQSTIISDTPIKVARNYGSLGHSSAALRADAPRSDHADITHRVIDYPSSAPASTLVFSGGVVTSSSAASDATNFPAPRLDQAATAAIDSRTVSAWYPRAGASAGEWIELRPDAEVPDPVISVRLSARTHQAVTTTVTVHNGDAHITKELQTGKDYQLRLPGGSSHGVRLELGRSLVPVGVADFGYINHPITSSIRVPAAPRGVQAWIFQRYFYPTAVLERSFEVPEVVEVEVVAQPCENSVLIDQQRYRCGDRLTLSPGVHFMESYAHMVRLEKVGAQLQGAPLMPLEDSHPTDAIAGATIKPTEYDRVLLVSRAYQSGLEATLGNQQLSPMVINAGMQGFVLPANNGGEFRLRFAGESGYRSGLLLGALMSLFTALIALLSARARPRLYPLGPDSLLAHGVITAITLIGLMLAAGWWVAPLAVVVSFISRYSYFSRGALMMGTGVVLALWYARAPWPAPNYAGDNLAVTVLSATLLLLLVFGPKPEPDTVVRSG
ncbi:DUF3367 domain-containing protein [Corynebacterium sp. ES2715-CONJ3]|nr:DUF3367 domain-containing protein [Corynebacterium sp. ES2715-CONJ3]